MSTYGLHPFMKNLLPSSFTSYFPPQKISWKEKHKNKDKFGVSDWAKANMDPAGTIAIRQLQENKKLIDNERLVNGEMVASVNPEDMCEDCEQDFSDVLYRLQSDGTLPRIIKNYDMIGIPIKQQVTEFNDRPDTLSVEGYGEPMENDRFKVQADQVKKWAMEQLDLYFNDYLKSQDIDIDQEFETEEEQQQAEQYIESLRQERSPEEIGRYMKNDYRHYFEEWAAYELEDQEVRFKLKKLRRREFYHYLITGRRFRYLNITKDGFHVETLDYTEVYYHKNSSINLPQFGNYIGKIQVESSSSIVNKYGDLLAEEQLKSFDSFNTYWKDRPARPNTDLFGNKVDYLDTDGLPFNQFLASGSARLNRLAPNPGINWVTPVDRVLDEEIGPDQFYVIHHFWRSYAKVGRLAWTNPTTGMFEVKEVDETFVVPFYIKVLKKGTFSDPVEPDTLIWTWKEEIWEGKKISRSQVFSDFGDIYFDIKPCEYQGAPYAFRNKPFPIVGQVGYSSNLNLSTQVEIYKPYAFMYNLAMNKAYKLLELSYASFLAMEMRSIPNQKDWGGEDGLFKWLEAAQESLIAPVDTSPSAMQGANSGSLFPKIIDIDNTQKALAAFSIAAQIRQVALSQAGFTPQRLGDMKGINTATGVEEGLAKSFSASESWFTEFWEAEVEIIQQQLDVAQWLQSKGKDFTALMSKGIISESILTNNFDNFDLFSLRIYVSNSQEQVRQLELYRKLALDNTTDADMSTRMQMVTSNNAQVILNIVKHEEEKARQRQEQMQQMAQEIEKEKEETKRMELEMKYRMHQEEMINNLQREAIKASSWTQGADNDNSGVPDVFEYEKHLQKASNDSSKLNISRDKLSFDKERESTRKTEKQQEFNLKQQEILQRQEQVRATQQNVKYLDKGTYKGKKK